ncbi:MAG: LapA family protein [Ahrensia sp.]
MLRRLITVLFVVPVAIVLIALSVANRQVVPVSLDVFNPGNPLLTFSAPMFAWMFGAMAVGIVIGGIATWFTQGKHRKHERELQRETDKLRYEVEDTKRKANIGEPTSGQALVMQRN